MTAPPARARPPPRAGRALRRAPPAAAPRLRRQGAPDEAADAAVFLASDAAAFITGANLDVNGGTYFS